VSGDDELLDIRADPRGMWTFRAPEELAGQFVDSVREDGRSSLSDALGVLDSLEVAAFRTPDALPDRDPDATIHVSWKDGGTTRRERLDVYRVDAEWIVLSSHRPGEVFVVGTGGGPLDELLSPGFADRLRDLKPVQIAESDWGGLTIELPDADPLQLTRPSADVAAEWSGDDAWGRRVGLGLAVLNELRGYRWQPARPDAEYPWRLVFTGFDGTPLGTLALREPGIGESPEILGHPAAIARWSGTPDLELVIHRNWLERLGALTRDQGRVETQHVELRDGR
jgi:hypothetical protein